LIVKGYSDKSLSEQGIVINLFALYLDDVFRPAPADLARVIEGFLLIFLDFFLELK
jgi:hypothetical protein